MAPLLAGPLDHAHRLQREQAERGEGGEDIIELSRGIEQDRETEFRRLQAEKAERLSKAKAAEVGVLPSPLEALGNIKEGLKGAAKETLKFAADAFSLHGRVMETGGTALEPIATGSLAAADFIRRAQRSLGDVQPADSIVGGLIQGFSQVLPLFIPILREARALPFVSRMLASGRVTVRAAGEAIAGMLAGIPADALAFDPADPRLSNLLQKLGVFDGGLAKSVVDFLAAPVGTEAEELRRGDTLSDLFERAKGRGKNAAEGAPLGLVLDGVLLTARAARAFIKKTGVIPGGLQVTLDDAAGGALSPRDFNSPEATQLTQDVVGRFGTTKSLPDALFLLRDGQKVARTTESLADGDIQGFRAVTGAISLSRPDRITGRITATFDAPPTPNQLDALGAFMRKDGKPLIINRPGEEVVVVQGANEIRNLFDLDAPGHRKLDSTPARNEEVTTTPKAEGKPAVKEVPNLSFPIDAMKASLDENGGFTFNQVRGDMGRTPNYVVSPFPELTNAHKNHGVIQGRATAEDIDEFIQAVSTVVPLDNPRVHVGGWYDAKTDQTYLDVSVTFPHGQFARAKAMGIEFNQKEITDLATFEGFDTGGTGEGLIQAEIPNIAPTFTERLRLAGITEPDAPGVTVSKTSPMNLRDEFTSLVSFERNADGQLVPVGASVSKKGLLKAPALTHAANVGAALLARGVRSRKDFVRAMKSHLKMGRGTLDPALVDQLYAKAKSTYEANLDKVLETADGLPSVARLEKMATDGKFRLDWYDNAFGELVKVFDGDASTIAKLLAAVSPQVPVDRSVDIAMRAYKALKTSPTWEDYLKNIEGDGDLTAGFRIDNLERVYRGMDLSGPKVAQFYRNIIGDPDAVTVDTWMMKIFYGNRPPDAAGSAKGANAGEVAFIGEFVRQMAEEMKVEPRQLQAALWVGKQIQDELGFDVQKGFEFELDQKVDADFNAFNETLRERIEMSIGDGTLKFPASETQFSAGLIPLPDKMRFGTWWLISRAAAGALYGAATGEDDADSFKRSFLFALGATAAGGIRPRGFMNIVDTLSKRGAKLVAKQRDTLRGGGDVTAPNANAVPSPGAATSRAHSSDVTSQPLEGGATKRAFDFPRVEADQPESIAKTYAEAVEEQRRGVRHDVDVEAEADQITPRLTAKFVRDILPGTTMNDAEVLAVAKVMNQVSDKLVSLAVQAKARGYDDESMAAFMKQLGNFMEMDPKRLGVIAETGRAERILGHEAAQGEFLSALEGTVRDATAGIPPRRLVDRVAKLKTAEKIAAFGMNITKPTYTDMFLEVWVNGLLSSLRTFARNFCGNAATLFWSVPERSVSRGFKEAGVEGGIARGEALAMLKGIFGNIGDAWRLARQGFMTEQPTFGVTKLDIRPKTISSENLRAAGAMGSFLDRFGSMFGLDGDTVGRLVRIPGRGLVAADEFFKSLNFNAELRAQAHREGAAVASAEGLTGKAYAARMAEVEQAVMLDIPPSIRASAEQFATYNTFQKALGPRGQHFQAIMSHPVGRIVMPFQRTPMNVAKFSGERTPFAVFSNAVKDELLSDDPVRRQMALGKMYMGSMSMAFFAVLAGSGLITSSGPTDPDLRSQKMQLGWRPTSIVLDTNSDGVRGGPGDTYIPLSKIEPFGSLIILAADAAIAIANMDPEDNAVAKLASAVTMAAVAAFNSRQFVMGLSRVVGILSGEERDLKGFLRDFARGLLPFSSAMRDVARQFDPVLRHARGVVDSALQGVPGYSKTLRPRRNLFAEKVLAPDAVGPDFISFVTIGTGKNEPVFSEFDRLEFAPQETPEDIEGIVLTPEQIDRLSVLIGKEVKLGGKTLRPFLHDRIFKSSTYKRMSDDRRRALLLTIISDFRDKARNILVKEFRDTLGVSLTQAREEKNTERRTPGPSPLSIGVGQ